MPDTENVIKAIEICYTVGHNCTECPRFNEDDCNDRLMRDVLAILREHEPVKPVKEQIFSSIFGWNCGACGFPLLCDGFIYCPNCGKRVKWDS